MSYPLTTWRLLHTPPSRGAWNMAVDEAILEAAGRGEVLPTLRLYAWEPPCLSLGYAQPSSDVDFDALLRFGWDLVRRPTGGRAILHTDEITYSVIGPQEDPRLVGSVNESYRILAAALLRTLHILQIPAQALEKHTLPAGSDPNGAVCFEVPSNYEITVNGKKLIGSAQARRKEGVLQHGSLPLYGELARITQVLGFPQEAGRTEAANRLLARAATAEEILGTAPSWTQAARAFKTAFCETLNLDLQPAELTPAELARAASLVEEKYAHLSWTNRR